MGTGFRRSPADGILINYGDYYLSAIEKAIRKEKGTKAAPIFTAGWLGNYFAKMMPPVANGTAAKK